jgi:hypothetical protein
MSCLQDASIIVDGVWKRLLLCLHVGIVAAHVSQHSHGSDCRLPAAGAWLLQVTICNTGLSSSPPVQGSISQPPRCTYWSACTVVLLPGRAPQGLHPLQCQHDAVVGIFMHWHYTSISRPCTARPLATSVRPTIQVWATAMPAAAAALLASRRVVNAYCELAWRAGTRSLPWAV